MTSPGEISWLLPFLAKRDLRMLRPWQLKDWIKIQAGLGVSSRFFSSEHLTRVRFSQDAILVYDTDSHGTTGAYSLAPADQPTTRPFFMGKFLELLVREPRPQYWQLLAHCVKQELPPPTPAELSAEAALLGLSQQLAQLKALKYDPFSIESDHQQLSAVLGDYPGTVHPVVVLITRFTLSCLGPQLENLDNCRRLEYEALDHSRQSRMIGTFPYQALRSRVKSRGLRFQDWTPRLVAMVQLEGTLVDDRQRWPPRLVDASQQSLFSRVAYRQKARVSCRPTVDEDGLLIGNELSYQVFASLPASPTDEYDQAAIRAMDYAANPSKHGSCGYGLPLSRQDILDAGCDQLALLQPEDNARQLAWILDSIERLRFTHRARRGRTRLSDNRSTAWLLAYEAERTGLHPLLYLIKYYDLDLIYRHLGQASLHDLHGLEPSHLRALCQPHWLLAQTVIPTQLMDPQLIAAADPRLPMKLLARGHPAGLSELPQWYLDGYSRDLPATEPATQADFLETASQRGGRAGSYIKSMAGFERGGLLAWAAGNLHDSTLQ